MTTPGEVSAGLTIGDLTAIRAALAEIAERLRSGEGEALAAAGLTTHRGELDEALHDELDAVEIVVGSLLDRAREPTEDWVGRRAELLSEFADGLAGVREAFDQLHDACLGGASGLPRDSAAADVDAVEHRLFLAEVQAERRAGRLTH